MVVVLCSYLPPPQHQNSISFDMYRYPSPAHTSPSLPRAVIDVSDRQVYHFQGAELSVNFFVRSRSSDLPSADRLNSAPPLLQKLYTITLTGIEYRLLCACIESARSSAKGTDAVQESGVQRRSDEYLFGIIHRLVT